MKLRSWGISFSYQPDILIDYYYYMLHRRYAA